MASQRCPTCASAVPATATICPTCGSPLNLRAPASDPNLFGVLPPGTQLNNGSYSIGRMLGRGGFGITYLGADLGLKRTVAIKEFFPAGTARTGTSVIFSGALTPADYDLAIRKFMQEAQMLARFQHRSIVNVHEVFRENDTAYMVMEFLEGEHLLQRMERRGAPLAERELIGFTAPIAEALDEVHAAGVLHRDIKPENIMLVGDEHAPRPVLIDFGAAREFASGMANRHSIVLTPGYAPLEQYGEHARRGPFTDVYALAATLYHIATGQQPPAATERALGVTLKSPRELNPALSAAFDAALLHGLEMKVDARPATASAFYQELATGRAASNVPVPQPAARQPKRATPPPPPGQLSHYERVREIAREGGKMGQIDPNRSPCPVCRQAEMFDISAGVAEIRCPVCHDAMLQEQYPTSGPLTCPSCARGELQPVDLGAGQPGPMLHCPACKVGSVVAYIASQMLFIPDLQAECDTCYAHFDYHSTTDSLTLEDLPNGPGQLSNDWIGETRTRAEWAGLSGDVADAYLCGVCNSAFQTCADGGLEWVARDGEARRVPREHRGQCRSSSAWMRIAHRLPDDAGNVVCPNCDARFEEPRPGTLTLLAAATDPSRTFASHRGHSYPSATWVAIGAGWKPPSGKGRICPNCSAFLRSSGRGDRSTLDAYDPSIDPDGNGQRYDGQTLPDHDWKRIAAGGVPEAEDRRLREEAQRELWAAMLAGQVSTEDAKRSFPRQIEAGEEVITTFTAVVVRSRFGFYYRHDGGQGWLTSRQLLFKGNKGEIAIRLAESSACVVFDASAESEAIAEIRGHDGKDLLRLQVAEAPIELLVDGLAVSVPWNADAFAELFESLRVRASQRGAA